MPLFGAKAHAKDSSLWSPDCILTAEACRRRSQARGRDTILMQDLGQAQKLGLNSTGMLCCRCDLTEPGCSQGPCVQGLLQCTCCDSQWLLWVPPLTCRAHLQTPRVSPPPRRPGLGWGGRALKEAAVKLLPCGPRAGCQLKGLACREKKLLWISPLGQEMSFGWS